MKSSKLSLISFAIVCIANFASAQHAQLHINPKWEECSFQLDPSLTQQEWNKFTKEAGMVTYFRSLTDARPMGVGNFELSVLQWNTVIDENTGAWNNTFVHPDDEHWLIDGEQLPFPGLMARGGVSRKMDVAVFWGARTGANYGVFGGQVQYNLLNDTAKKWAVSTRASFNNLYGPADLNLTVYGVDFLASKEIPIHSHWLGLSPYAGVSGYLSHAHEKTDAVNLTDENILGVQGMVGAVARVSIVRIGVEYNVANVNTLSYKIGAAFRIKSMSK